MAGADVQMGNQSIPGAFGLTDKMIATIQTLLGERRGGLRDLLQDRIPVNN